MKNNLTPNRKMCPKCQYIGDDFTQIVQTTMSSDIKLESPSGSVSEARGCPCLVLDEPCHPNCTCKNGLYSGGCLYCAKYGNLQQRKEAAEKIKHALANASKVEQQEEHDPYWYWPQCDVDECKGVSGYNGMGWKETGYWCLCSDHANEFREGKPQPKMKREAIDREASREKETGFLPSNSNLNSP